MTHFLIRRIKKKTRVRFLRFLRVIEPSARSAHRRIIFRFGQSPGVWRETPVERESIRKMQHSAYSPHRARLLWPEGMSRLENALLRSFEIFKARNLVILLNSLNSYSISNYQYI